jgi:hypothetical protein
MGESVRKVLFRIALAFAFLLIAPPVCAYAENVPAVDPSQLGKAAESAIGQLENVKIGAQGATLTIGGKQVGFDVSGVAGATGVAGGTGGGNVMGTGMLFFGASVLTRLLSTVARIFRPRSRRERWIET